MEMMVDMSPFEVRASRQKGEMIAATIRASDPPDETFRFPHALLMLAIGSRHKGLIGNFGTAVRRALEWSNNPRLTETDAEAFVRKIIRQHKAEIIAAKQAV